MAGVVTVGVKLLVLGSCSINIRQAIVVGNTVGDKFLLFPGVVMVTVIRLLVGGSCEMLITVLCVSCFEEEIKFSYILLM